MKVSQKGQTEQPMQDEQHIRKRIADFDGTLVASAWWEFNGGLEGSRSGS